MRIEEIKIWPDRNDVSLCAYILDDLPEVTGGRSRPAVIVIPGGGYLFTSDREAEPVALRFAGFGYHAFVLRYTVFIDPEKWPSSWQNGSFNPAEGNRRSAWPGPLIDLARAMLLIRKNAGRWQLDPDQVALCGFSAGGHLAASLGVRWQDPFLKETLKADQTWFRPAAMLLGYPVTDFSALFNETRRFRSIDPANTDFLRASSLATFLTDQPDGDALRIASPINYVSRLAPPAFIWHTSADRLVPVDQSLHFAAALAREGVPCELHVFENGPHGLSLADSTTLAAPDLAGEPAQAWIQMAKIWLGRHLPTSRPEEHTD